MTIHWVQGAAAHATTVWDTIRGTWKKQHWRPPPAHERFTRPGAKRAEARMIIARARAAATRRGRLIHPKSWLKRRRMVGTKRKRADFYGSRKRARTYGGRGARRPAIPANLRGRVRTTGYYGGSSAAGGGELKFHDIAVFDAVVAQVGTIQNAGTINIIPQGTTEVERIGRKCTVKKIGLRYHITLPGQESGATALSGDTVRVILYKDKQCNGFTATVAGILKDDDWLSFNNLANKSRFLILMDRTHDINYGGITSEGAGAVTQGRVVDSYSYYKKCNIPLEFSDVTGALTEIRSNNLGILLISENGQAGFLGQVRLRFFGN